MRGTGREGPWGGFEMSPGRRCGSGSTGRGPQVLVQHRDPLREQRVHIERELHGPLCAAGPAPRNVTSAPPSAPRPPQSLFPLQRPAGPGGRPAPTPSLCVLAAGLGDPVLLASLSLGNAFYSIPASHGSRRHSNASFLDLASHSPTLESLSEQLGMVQTLCISHRGHK